MSLLDTLDRRFTRAWPWAVNGFAIFGLASALSVAWFGLKVAQYERENHRRYAGPPISVSPVAARIAAKFAPELVSLATEHKDGVVAASGNAIERFAVRTIYPAGVKAIPYATEIGCDRALTYLNSLTMGEVATAMIDHAKASGCQVDYSVWVAAEAKR